MGSKCLNAFVFVILLAGVLLFNFVLLGGLIEVFNWALYKQGWVNSVVSYHRAFDLGIMATLFIQSFALFVPRRFKWL